MAASCPHDAPMAAARLSRPGGTAGPREVRHGLAVRRYLRPGRAGGTRRSGERGVLRQRTVLVKCGKMPPIGRQARPSVMHRAPILPRRTASAVVMGTGEVAHRLFDETVYADPAAPRAPRCGTDAPGQSHPYYYNRYLCNLSSCLDRFSDRRPVRTTKLLGKCHKFHRGELCHLTRSGGGEVFFCYCFVIFEAQNAGKVTERFQHLLILRPIFMCKMTTPRAVSP